VNVGSERAELVPAVKIYDVSKRSGGHGVVTTAVMGAD
jgi:hypothetical protein